MRYLISTRPRRSPRSGLAPGSSAPRSGATAPTPTAEANAIVRAASSSVHLFDTAEIYGFGRSERILGQALGEDLRVDLPGDEDPAGHADRSCRAAARSRQRGRLGAGYSICTRCTSRTRRVRDGTIMRGCRPAAVGLVDRGRREQLFAEALACGPRRALGSRVLPTRSGTAWRTGVLSATWSLRGGARAGSSWPTVRSPRGCFRWVHAGNRPQPGQAEQPAVPAAEPGTAPPG